MLLDDFVKKYLGKEVDFDGAYAGQCVDLYRQYVQEVLELPQPNPVSGAKLLWESFDIDKNLYTYYDKISNSTFGIPEKGDVVIWNGNAGNGYGHVSIFLEGGILSFKSFDQNWPTLSVCTITEHNYKNIYGWLRPKISKEIDYYKKRISTLESEIKRLKEALVTSKDYEERWTDALKLFDLPSNSKWKPFKDKVNKLFSDLENSLEKIQSLENAISHNVTNLDAKKDDKYIYDTISLLNEIIRRIRG